MIMNEKEILKAAEICHKNQSCEGCPFDYDCETECSEKFAEYIVGKIQNENNDGETENIKACYNSLSEAKGSVNKVIKEIIEAINFLNLLKSYISQDLDFEKENLK